MQDGCHHRTLFNGVVYIILGNFLLLFSKVKCKFKLEKKPKKNILDKNHAIITISLIGLRPTKININDVIWMKR